jgi:hypothetical protein
MADYVGRTFVRERIVIDGNNYRGCKFHHCTLVFNATAETNLGDCDLEAGTQLVVGDGVNWTFKLLYQLYHGGFPDYVESIFDRIRQPYQPPALEVDPENQQP